ncbi:MAG: LacI family DNA-binding transcriptional regulator [Kiritimatiellales bacterium]
MSTLRDIAQKAGVSVPTVSRILNPRGTHISARPETIKRIRDAADELHYTPNAAARSLSTSRTQNIALLLDSARDNPEEDFYWAPIIRGIAKQCRRDSTGCLISLEKYREADRFEIPLSIREKKVDGFIATHPIGMNNVEFIDKLILTRTPFVIVSFFSSDPRVWSISCDPAIGYRDACRHLAGLGHKKIGYMIYPEWTAAEDRIIWSPERASGEKLVFSPVTIDLSQYNHAKIAEGIAEKIVSGKLDITALIIGDIIGIHLIAQLAAKGIRVPEDFSIVGFDDSYVCTLSSPKLTSIQCPLEEMGVAAVSMLSERIKAEHRGQSIAARHLSLPKSFIVRDSTGPAPID